VAHLVARLCDDLIDSAGATWLISWYISAMTYSGSLGTMYQRASANTQAPPVLQSVSSQRAPVNQYVAPRPTLPPIGANLVAPRLRALPLSIPQPWPRPRRLPPIDLSPPALSGLEGGSLVVPLLIGGAVLLGIVLIVSKYNASLTPAERAENRAAQRAADERRRDDALVREQGIGGALAYKGGGALLSKLFKNRRG